jgi:PhzF family phenazine biosynthesis protein
VKSIRFLQIDAFTDRPFAGNPAAVCLLDNEADEVWMQKVAQEMNLSETAFVYPIDRGFSLRWFTPAIEVELCGHATLASAHALWSERRVDPGDSIEFETKSGVLTCRRQGNRIEMDFPATPPEAADAPDGLIAAMGMEPSFVGRSRYDKFLLVGSEDQLRAITPDFPALRKISMRGVIVTSLADDSRFDFISRYFAPAAGIDEDPVTGSAHCCLAPFWSERLGRNEMTAFQASVRGGTVHVRVAGDRVFLGGHAVTVAEGTLLAR